MSGKSAREERQARAAQWQSVMNHWQTVLRELDAMDKELIAMGEKKMANALLEMSLPMSVNLVYASGGQMGDGWKLNSAGVPVRIDRRPLS